MSIPAAFRSLLRRLGSRRTLEREFDLSDSTYSEPTFEPTIQAIEVIMSRKKPKTSDVDQKICELLNMARDQAIKELDGMRADVPGLYALACKVKHFVLVQAVFGQWSFVGIDSSEGFANLKVDAIIRKDWQLMGRAPIQIVYDFSQTACPHIQFLE